MNDLLVPQIHMCACGLAMREMGTTGVYMCVTNCDYVQERERHHQFNMRIPSDRDKAFNAEWKKRERRIYDGITEY